jgi:hypothetical protein
MSMLILMLKTFKVIHSGITCSSTIRRQLEYNTNKQEQIIYGGSVLAQRTRCTYYRKYILNNFKMSKKLDKKFSVYISTMYLHPQSFAVKRHFYGMCKKIRNGYVNNNVGASKFVIFTEATKNILFSQNFVNDHEMSCTSKYFFPKFYNF